jgi:hypothetical protein
MHQKIRLSVILKIIAPIINNHLDDTQLGFRKGRGTLGGILLLRCLLERRLDKQKKTYLIFVDYTKAFDRVNHEKLNHIMSIAGIPSHERNLIIQRHWNQTATVRTSAGRTKKKQQQYNERR